MARLCKFIFSCLKKSSFMFHADKSNAFLSAISVVTAVVLTEINSNDVFFTDPSWIGQVAAFFGTVAYYLNLTLLIGSLVSIFFGLDESNRTVVTPHIGVFACMILFYFLQNSMSEIAYSFQMEVSDYKQYQANTGVGYGEFEGEISSTDLSQRQKTIVYICRAIPHFLFFFLIFPYVYLLYFLSAKQEQHMPFRIRFGPKRSREAR